MKKTVLIIFITILLLHLGALALFLMSQEKDDPSEKEMEEPTAPPTLVPESGLSHTKATPRSKQTHTSKSSKTKNSTKVRQKTVTRIKHRRMSPIIPGRFHSYDYSKSVKGNIPEIRESRNAKSGILLDADTGRVLWSKNSKKAIPIASMTKMMTALITFEDIRSGKASMNDSVRVTKAAAKIGGSDIWLDSRETFKLGDLLKAMLVKSANDAAYLIAQTMAGGSEVAFVKRMNKRAKELGLKKAKFNNPHGLPEKRLGANADSPEELAFLASILMKYPEVLKLTSTKIDYIARKIGKFKRTQLVNTNKLVRSGCPGVDGMKTGYTRKAGFCITLTCKRNGKRVIAVLTGFPSSKKRNTFAKKLLDWGYKRLK